MHVLIWLTVETRANLPQVRNLQLVYGMGLKPSHVNLWHFGFNVLLTLEEFMCGNLEALDLLFKLDKGLFEAPSRRAGVDSRIQSEGYELYANFPIDPPCLKREIQRRDRIFEEWTDRVQEVMWEKVVAVVHRTLVLVLGNISEISSIISPECTRINK